MEMNRRAFVRTLCGTTALSAFAGCSTLENLGTGNSIPEYTDWLYDPSVINESSYGFEYSKPSQFWKYHNELNDQSLSNLETTYDDWENGIGIEHVLDINWKNLDEVLVSTPYRFVDGTVISADFDSENVIDYLQRFAHRQDGAEWRGLQEEYNGFEIYYYESTHPLTIMLGEKYIAIGTENIDQSKKLIDTYQGNIDRYQDNDSNVHDLIDVLGTGTNVQGKIDKQNDNYIFENQMGNGTTHQINGENTDIKLLFMFESESRVPIEDVNSYVKENSNVGDYFGILEDISTSQSGRFAIVQAVAKTRDLSVS